jgi:hypothetical protein
MQIRGTGIREFNYIKTFLIKLEKFYDYKI